MSTSTPSPKDVSEAMKQISCFPLIFIFLLILVFSHSTTWARFLSPYQGEQKVKANGDAHAGSSIKEYDLFNLMGLDECGDQEDEDEECLKRRVIAEAHLDYIYTQHHKPKG